MPLLASIPLADADATADLARILGARLGAGDVLLLEGPIGAGKTHFARALIQDRVPEDVPSPTFTLVQTYDAPGLEIWHADLYRLSGIDDIAELGLFEAFETALCLVEWPERLGDEAPRKALTLRFFLDGDGRRLELWSDDAGWSTRLSGLMHV